MTIQIRIRPEEPPHEIPVEDFDRLTREGAIPPETLVWGRFLTHGEWRTADNLRRYHKHNPRPVPPGAVLREELGRAALERRRRAEIAALERNYREGSLLEQRFGLAPLGSLARARGVLGAARLLVLPSFQPERVVTVIYRHDGVHVEGVRGETILWNALHPLPSVNGAPTEDGLPRLPEGDLVRFERSMSGSESEDAFMGFEELRTRAREATDTEGAVLAFDGIGFRHQVAAPGEDFERRWNNPTSRRDRASYALVRAYEGLERRIGLLAS